MAVTNNELMVIAETDMARAMSKDIPKMESFLDDFVRSLPKKDRMLAGRYLAAREKAIDDYLAAAAAAGNTTPED